MTRLVIVVEMNPAFPAYITDRFTGKRRDAKEQAEHMLTANGEYSYGGSVVDARWEDE